MSLSTEIFAVLSADPQITAIVEGRLFPQMAPLQTKTPFVVWGLIQGLPQLTHDDDGTNTQYRDSYQFDCYAMGFDEAENLGALVKTAILGSDIGQAQIFEGIRNTFDPSSERYTQELDIVFWR